MPPSPKIHPYDPAKPGNADRIKSGIWEMFRDIVITRYEQGESKTKILKAIRSHPLAEENDFHPTIHQLKLKMDKWGLVEHEEKTATANTSTIDTDTDTNTNTDLPISAESSSMDTDSLNSEDLTSNIEFLASTPFQSQESIVSVGTGGDISNAKTWQKPIDNIVISCELLALWLGFACSESLTTLQVREIHEAARCLEATRILDDAFDLFYIEYRYWQTLASTISTNENLTQIVTASVNCARTCRTSERETIAQDVLREALDTLAEHGAGFSLESALLRLYLSNGLRDKSPQESRTLLDSALALTISCDKTCFAIILPEIQDREHLFMAKTLELPSSDHFGCYTTGVPQLHRRLIAVNMVEFKHFSGCEQVMSAFVSLLKWCKAIIHSKRYILHRAAGVLSRSAPLRHSSVWLLYFCCYCEYLDSPSSTKSERTKLQWGLCYHGDKWLQLDISIALVVIIESFQPFRTDNPVGRLKRRPFSSYCVDEINAILGNQGMKLDEIVKTYFSRMIGMPEKLNEFSERDISRSSLIREYIKASVQTKQWPVLDEFTALSQSVCTLVSLPSSSKSAGSRNSLAGSVQSSLNTIRSSWSLDTRLMMEMVWRFNRHNSRLSIWSKDTNHSNARSTNSHDSNTFERVTGMPSSAPDTDDNVDYDDFNDTIMTGRISEGMDIDS